MFYVSKPVLLIAINSFKNITIDIRNEYPDQESLLFVIAFTHHIMW